MTSGQNAKIPAGLVILGLSLFFCHALFLRNHQVASEAISEGLLLCAKAVIPSLFPFLVLSSMLLEGSFDALLLSPLARKLGWNPSVFCALFLGLLCGAPVGAVVLAKACDKGSISKERAGHLLCLIGCPSLPFTVGTVGGVFLGSLRLGWLLWLATLPGLILCGFLFCKKKEERGALPIDQAPPPRFAVLLSRGVLSGLRSILLVCAYVVFFSALFSALRYCFSALSLSPALSAFFYCLFELSGGLAEASTLPTPFLYPLCGFALGFSGFAIYFQVLSLTERSGISTKTYLPAKLLQGTLCAFLFPLFCRLCKC